MSKIASIAKILHRAFGDIPWEVNQEVGVIQRQRKFDPMSLAASFVLAFLRNPLANENDVAEVAAILGVNVSPQAVDQRFSVLLARFFRRLFEKLSSQVVCHQESLAPLLERFTEVILIDSTGFGLPSSLATLFPGCGGSGNAEGNRAAIKFQTELDLRSGALRCVQPEPGRSPDQATDRQSVVPRPGGLRIGDLGYFSIKVFRAIVAAKAHFLSRIQLQTRVIDEQGKLVQVIDYLNAKARVDFSGLIDEPIILGRDEQLTCRMIAWKVPSEIAARRRKAVRAASRKRGKSPTKRALANCDWNYLVTDLDQDQLTVEEAIVLYRSRWQIELLFKRWKSLCRIDVMEGRDEIHIQTKFWIRMCAALVQHYLVVACCWYEDRAVSFTRVAKHLRSQIVILATVMESMPRLKRRLEIIVYKAKYLCRRTKRRKKPAWIDLLRDPSLLEYCLT